MFVSIANFTPELLPKEMLYKIAASEQATPLPLFLEAMLVTFLLEIVREAGLRLPKPIGHSVSLVAALIVGDAAVSAGLVGTPVVIVAALTAICTFVVPSLYEPIIVLRLLFILAGGLLGPLGIAGMFFCMLVSASGMARIRHSISCTHRALNGRVSAGRHHPPCVALACEKGIHRAGPSAG